MLTANVDGQKLRELRESRELTARELTEQMAKDLGRRVHIDTIYKIERGSRQPSSKLLGAWCRALKTDRAIVLDSIKDCA
ncbi:helix-turn-helix domain-containing protein [Allokutzneria sp. A3M-2-11 16]|uniref:helix-turn-helix domain-containing protein n=1 Tax=Allokutzneria sp. A3M-2-11 16 TaxID=2962043 RepID=UPI0020B8FF03|nr:helix-turn-helix transcriptional regulator [Allokutzneria sp. A3M-2-11 16]MCP3805421.1 helix-turn-helix domain-containing protein [Allokutzneria sp. A3M-2-11 16]